MSLSCSLRTERQTLAVGSLALVSAAALFYASSQSWPFRGTTQINCEGDLSAYVDTGLAEWDRRFLKKHGNRKPQSRASKR